jgi:hypothetical protein
VVDRPGVSPLQILSGGGARPETARCPLERIANLIEQRGDDR